MEKVHYQLDHLEHHHQGRDNYQAVTLKEVIRGVIDAVPQVMNRAPGDAVAVVAGTHADGSAKLTQAAPEGGSRRDTSARSFVVVSDLQKVLNTHRTTR
jgi:hypothetical protein